MEKVFSALADSNRRKIIELLHEKDSTLLELSKDFQISFQALSKHIRILEEAQIVSKKKVGKYRVLSLESSSFKPSLEWINRYSNFWNDSFDKLTNLIDQQNLDASNK